ncbi:MAG: hypothetical protein D6785_05385 [Planctomycetota bacterium]|nr:MAG: hypothetical protein D6785_05385 [Planctomycetota bacterium]
MRYLTCLLFLLVGCYCPRLPKAGVVEFGKNRARLEAYVKLMEKKKTKPEQDLEMMKATLKAWEKAYEMLRKVMK